MSNYVIVPQNKELVQILNSSGDMGSFMFECPINLLDTSKWLIAEKEGARVYNPKPIYDTTTIPEVLLYSKGWYEVTEVLPGIYDWRKILESQSGETIEYPDLDAEEITTKYLTLDYVGYRFFQTTTTYKPDSSVRKARGWYEVVEVIPATTPRTFEWVLVQDNGGNIPILEGVNINMLQDSGSFSIKNGTNTPLASKDGILTNKDDGAGRKTQRFVVVSSGEDNDNTYTRTYFNGVWSDWNNVTGCPSWNSLSNYSKGDWVEYRNKAYRCKKNAAAGVTPSNTTYWELVSIQTLRDNQIQLLATVKVGNEATWVSPYISNSNNYLAYIHCSDMSKKVTKREIDGNTLKVEFNDNIESCELVLKMELENI